MDIPTYLVSQGQAQFVEALTQTLREGVGENGFQIPTLNTSQVNELYQMSPDIIVAGTLFFNAELTPNPKLQVVVGFSGDPLMPVIETIQSM